MIGTPPTFTMNPTPIQQAGNLGLAESLSRMPGAANIIRGWFRPMVIGLTSAKFVSGGQAEEVTRETNCNGHLQPSEPEKLEMEADGDRSWKYFYLYLETALIMDPDDRVIIEGIPYRVIGKKDWSDGGFIRYRLLEDYRNATTTT